MELSLGMEVDASAWASAWAEGDTEAYEQIVRRYTPLVHARCRRALGSSDADDATQAVFLVLARRGDQAAASPVLAAWLYRVADLVIANARRDRRRRYHAERHVPPPAPSDVEAETTVEPGDDISSELDACLAGLPARERETVLLHHLAGHSLAEVASLTAAPVSTVKYRLSRGLERLRALLAKRGVVVVATALLACLQAEAQAQVPTDLARHLHDLAPGRTGGATTAPVRIRRWSRTESSSMSRIAFAGAALLLVGTSLTYHLGSSTHAAEPAALPPARPSETTKEFDAASARLLLHVQCPQVATTVERLRRQPEALLLKPTEQKILDVLSGLRRAELVVDLLSNCDLATRQHIMKPASDARHPKDGGLIQVQVGIDDHQTQMAATGEPVTVSVESRRSQPAATASDGRISWGSFVKHLAVWGRIDGAPGPQGATALSALQTRLGQVVPSYPWSLREDRLTIQQASGQGVPAPDGKDFHVAFPSSDDIQISLILDRGAPRHPRDLMGSLGARFEADGIRMSLTQIAGPREGTWTVGRGNVRDGIRNLPKSALAGGILHRSPGWLQGLLSDQPANSAVGAHQAQAPSTDGPAGPSAPSSFLASLQKKNPQAYHTMAPLIRALDQVDGDVIAWIQPATPLPSLWVFLPLGHDAAADLIRALGGSDPNHGFKTQLGMVPLQGRWRDGGLTMTTDPAGLDAQPAMHGFADHPEVRAALKSMPDQPSELCVVLRPAACLDALLPFAPLMLPAEEVSTLTSYRAAVADAQAWLTQGDDIHQRRFEAKGILCAVAMALAVKNLQESGVLLKAVN